MKTKKFYTGLIASIFTFIIGIIMVNNNLGKLSLLGFSGYILCTISLITLLTIFVCTIILTNEEKNQ